MQSTYNSYLDFLIDTAFDFITLCNNLYSNVPKDALNMTRIHLENMIISWLLLQASHINRNLKVSESVNILQWSQFFKEVFQEFLYDHIIGPVWNMWLVWFLFAQFKCVQIEYELISSLTTNTGLDSFICASPQHNYDHYN